MNNFIEIERNDNIIEIAFNRPQSFNAFNFEMIASLGEKLMEASTDPETRGVIITGRGKAFCAGGDIKSMVQSNTAPGAAFHRLASFLNLCVIEIRRMSKPVVAAINGLAAGAGFSLALACDFRIMEESALLRQAYTSNGLSIDGGGTFILPRLVGYAKAIEIIVFDESIPAKSAFEMGLVTKVVGDGSARAEANRLVSRIIQGSRDSFTSSKKLLNESYHNTLENHLESEKAGLAACADSTNGKEGITAFLEKRKPNFM